MLRVSMLHLPCRAALPFVLFRKRIASGRGSGMPSYTPTVIFGIHKSRQGQLQTAVLTARYPQCSNPTSKNGNIERFVRDLNRLKSGKAIDTLLRIESLATCGMKSTSARLQISEQKLSCTYQVVTHHWHCERNPGFSCSSATLDLHWFSWNIAERCCGRTSTAPKQQEELQQCKTNRRCREHISCAHMRQTDRRKISTVPRVARGILVLSFSPGRL